MRSTLLDRRIGLLFAIFLLLLGLAGLRAVWLGTVKADSLSERAATQQVEDLKVPAGRGTITDRTGWSWPSRRRPRPCSPTRC